MNFKKLTDFLDSLPREKHIPGLQCAVSYKHTEVYRHNVGYSDAKKMQAVSDRDLYWLYSATKPITVIAAMQLVEQGKLKLDDPVSKYLPEYADVTVLKDGNIKKAQNMMTVRHLFSMTSGLNYNIAMPSIIECKKATENKATTREIVAAIAKEPLLYEPGTFYSYSLSHDVLAAIVEVVSGMKYGEYLDQYIFQPLRIKDTGFYPSAERLNRMSAQYIWNAAGGVLNEIEKVNPYRLTEQYESGGAGLISCVSDYMRFADAVCNNGVSRDGVRIISESSINLMKANQLHTTQLVEFRGQAINKKGYGYGLGVRTKIENVPENSKSPIGEFGWDSAAGAYVLMDTVNNIAVFYAQHVRNCGHCYQEIHPQIRDLVYECIFENSAD